MAEATASPVRVFTWKDNPSGAFEGERIAVLGYGHLGRPFALNLRDAGAHSLVIGNIADAYARQAAEDGFEVLSIEEATRSASVVLVLLSDEVIPEIFTAGIAPYLQPGAAIVFASGYTLGYGLIEPPANVDVLLLAPRMAGENARQRYMDRTGFYAYVSVENDASGKAWPRLLGLAGGVGVLYAGAVELDARREADLDLLIEQTMGSVLGMAVMTAFSLGVEAGIPPEAMVMEMYMSGEMELVFRAFREQGFMRASYAHGPTAMYGGYLHAMEFMTSDLPAKFRKIFEGIRSGEFARGFQDERQAGYPNLSLAEAMALGDNPISQAEDNLRRSLAGG